MDVNPPNTKRKFDEKTEKRKLKMLKTGKWSDCLFVVGTEEKENIEAHRLMLAMASPVFETMFFGALSDQEKKPIHIKDIEPKAFKAMLEYVYTNKTDFNCFYEVCHIYTAAKKYMIDSLVEECKDFIFNHLSTENVCSAFSLFSLFIETELEEECLRYIVKTTKDVINHQSFEDLDAQCLKTILSQDKLAASELELWEGALKWSGKECERRNLEINVTNQREVIKSFLPLFRFLTMTGAEFANGPALSKILTERECLSILMNIVSPSVTKMQINLSTSRVTRNIYYDPSWDEEPDY